MKNAQVKSKTIVLIMTRVGANSKTPSLTNRQSDPVVTLSDVFFNVIENDLKTFLNDF